MPSSYPTLPGDIDHIIADDHAVVERRFQHLRANRGDRRVLVVPPDRLADMPPTLVITDERDVLRSQGEEFAATPVAGA